jgi:hypothetical protein
MLSLCYLTIIPKENSLPDSTDSKYVKTVVFAKCFGVVLHGAQQVTMILIRLELRKPLRAF